MRQKDEDNRLRFANMVVTAENAAGPWSKPSDLGLQWLGTNRPGMLPAYRVGGGKLVVSARGSAPSDAAGISLLPVNTAFEVEVEVEASPGSVGGIMLSIDRDRYAAVGADSDSVFLYRSGPRDPAPIEGGTIFVKLRNVDHDVVMFTSKDGVDWTKLEWGQIIDGTFEIEDTGDPLKIIREIPW